MPSWSEPQYNAIPSSDLNVSPLAVPTAEITRDVESVRIAAKVLQDHPVCPSATARIPRHGHRSWDSARRWVHAIRSAVVIGVQFVVTATPTHLAKEWICRAVISTISDRITIGIRVSRSTAAGPGVCLRRVVWTDIILSQEGIDDPVCVARNKIRRR